MTYIYLYLTPRLALAVGMAGVLTGDTVWITAHRDEDFLSVINPWITLVLSILVMIWGVVPERHRHYFDEVLWFIHGWWVVLFIRLTFTPQPHQVDGYDRASWICVYFSMSILALGIWFAARKRNGSI